MTILELYNKDNSSDDPDKDWIPMDTYVGKRVRYLMYDSGKEVWSNTVHEIESYNPNVCGDGCCDGFFLKDMPNESFWPSNLKIEEKI